MKNIGLINKQKGKYGKYNALKAIQYAFLAFLLCSALILGGNNVNAAELQNPQEGQTTTQASAETQDNTGKIIAKSGNKYYEYPDGKKVKSKFITIGKKTYYFGSTGAMEKGWMKKGKDYYYFDRNSGVQKKNCTVDGIKITKDGKAKKTNYSKKKIQTMIKAKGIVSKQTKVTDSKSKKLEKVFKWVMKHPYNRHRIFAKVRNSKGWEMTYANDIFKKNGNGCCVSESCALAFLAKECGYSKVYVCDDTAHSWVEINGRVYDTLFAEAKSYKNYYNSTYKVSKLHCVNKLKI